MLCRACRRQRPRDDQPCPSCGAARDGTPPQLELVLAAGPRVALTGSLTIGRASDCDIRLEDPSVSRHHATTAATRSGVLIADAGSSHGTFLNGAAVRDGGTQLRDGDSLRLGDTVLTVERPRAASDAGRTIVVPPGASLVLPQAGRPRVASEAEAYGVRPRLRPGWALKRLDAAEGKRRFMLADLTGRDYLRMREAEAELFMLLDGSCTLPDLIAESEQRLGPSGPATLTRLLADLGDRGLLEGVEGTRATGRPSGWRGWFTPRDFALQQAGAFFDRLYRAGGFLLFTRPAAVVGILLAIAGLIGFGALVVSGDAAPLIVHHSLGLGGLAFLAGRFVVVACHECAHGLTMASFGRRASRAGLKLMLIFPYAFVDTSEAWFEPRRRRIAVSLAGPISDAVLAGAFGLIAALAAGTVREVAFQVAFGAYLGGLLNLNPFLDRDGYHVLVDLSGQPGLRRRARERLAQRLEGKPAPAGGSRVLEVYAVAGVAWLLVAAAFGILMSVRYYPVLVDVAPSKLVAVAILAAFDLALLAPVVITVGRPLVRRRAHGREQQDGS
jgi:putative peptide zinc metalloprotease protein